MSDGTGIEWSDATWNPVVGCTRVSAGCDNCYAATLVDQRLYPAALASPEGLRRREAFPAPFAQVSVRPERLLTQPLRWRRPRRIFVNSLSDLFHDEVADEVIARVFAVMALAPQHTFQVLTKRPGRMRSLLGGAAAADFRDLVHAAYDRLVPHAAADVRVEAASRSAAWLTCLPHGPLPNVWLGVSVESQRWAEIRIPTLLKTPATVRWISAEPLLGPVDLSPWLPWINMRCPLHGSLHCATCLGVNVRTTRGDISNQLTVDSIVGQREAYRRRHEGLHWVVAGGESGPRARPVHPHWIRSLRDQCRNAAVPFMFKQWGEHGPVDHRVQLAPTRAWIPVTADVDGVPVEQMLRCGRKNAGRVLDGVVHDAYPHPGLGGR